MHRLAARLQLRYIDLIDVVDQQLCFLLVDQFELVVEKHEVRKKAVEVGVQVQQDDFSEVTVVQVGQHVEQQTDDLLDVHVEGTGKVFVCRTLSAHVL